MILAAALAAATAGATARASESLRWGGDSEGGAPYVFPDPKDPRQIVGFEVDIAGALGRELGRTALFVQNQWDGLIPGLLRGNYDIVLNGLEITPDRQQVIRFTIPYYATAEQLSVRREDTSVHGLGDLKGRVVGTLKFSLAQRILEKEPGIEVRTYEGQINAYEDLANGRLDAVLMDWPIAMYYSRPNPALKFTGEPIGRLEYGIGVRPQDTGLQKQLDAALLKLMGNGARLRHGCPCVPRRWPPRHRRVPLPSRAPRGNPDARPWRCPWGSCWRWPTCTGRGRSPGVRAPTSRWCAARPC